MVQAKQILYHLRFYYALDATLDQLWNPRVKVLYPNITCICILRVGMFLQLRQLVRYSDLLQDRGVGLQTLNT
ncbi:hypothetical protein ABKV19_009464 [Rosa sericea]